MFYELTFILPNITPYFISFPVVGVILYAVIEWILLLAIYANEHTTSFLRVALFFLFISTCGNAIFGSFMIYELWKRMTNDETIKKFYPSDPNPPFSPERNYEGKKDSLTSPTDRIETASRPVSYSEEDGLTKSAGDGIETVSYM